MKHSGFLIVFFLVFLSSPTQAETTRIDHLIDLGIEEHAADITGMAEELSLESRMEVYERNRKGPLVPAILNGTIGFGLGSLTEADWFGFAAQFCLDTAGYVYLFQAFMEMGEEVILFLDPETSGGMTLDEYRASHYDSTDMFIVALGGIVAVRLFGIYRAYWLAEGYNRTLSESLRISFAPVIQDGFRTTARLSCTLAL